MFKNITNMNDAVLFSGRNTAIAKGIDIALLKELQHFLVVFLYAIAREITALHLPAMLMEKSERPSLAAADIQKSPLVVAQKFLQQIFFFLQAALDIFQFLGIIFL